MLMRISEFASKPAFERQDEASLLNKYEKIEQNFHYWKGASGKRYLHTIYSLVECPMLPQTNYIMARLNNDGTRTTLRVGRTVENVCSLNLAHLRQKAAQLGANEIHVHLLSDSPKDRIMTEMDLRAGLFSHLGPENLKRDVTKQTANG